MRFLLYLFVIFLISFILVSCGNNTVKKNGDIYKDPIKTISPVYNNISPSEAKKRLENEKNIVLLDVRTREEYEEKHIPDSVLIPVDILADEAGNTLTDKNVPVFIYCRSGRRSVTAAKILIEKGYTDVYNLGGIIDWPYETESGS